MIRSNLTALCIAALAFAGCGFPEDSAEDEPLDTEFATDEDGLLVYSSTGEFEEEPPYAGWSIPEQADDGLAHFDLDAETADLPDAEDVFQEEGLIDPTLGTAEDAAPGDVADPDGVGQTEQDLVSCSKSHGTGYRKGRAFRVTLIKADTKRIGISAGDAFYYMERAAARAGVSLVVNSGFRTMAQQRYLYHCYLTKRCNGGNLAARPGYSNHQGGIAFDISTRRARVYTWLKRHARAYGFVRTVPSEPWHWEYRAGARRAPCK
ncbi:MAG: D-alanyl-D-alanine carboxypeptidase family protein [Archangiaceae bacterium]|nr:D-alanyl-D-alanine carboxypeptidase family protein [Archangiaceae bacterium]